MEDFDFRKAAEDVVAKFHIFDEEWREILVDQYAEALEKQMRQAKRKLHLLKGEVAGQVGLEPTT